MKKKLLYFAFLVISIASLLMLPASAAAHVAGDPYVTPLIAGGGGGNGITVGEVQVWNDVDNLYVKYVVTETGWYMTETHLAVELLLDNIPQTGSGNPKVGHFEFSDEYEDADNVTDDLYTIPLDGWGVGTELVIAAHAVVNGNSGILCAALPEQVTANILSLHWPGAPAYFSNIQLTGGTILDGNYEGWCFDTDAMIGLGSYLMNVYSYYCGDSLAGIIEYPENIDLVNYILNQDYVGKDSGCDGAFTYGDVQRAIWELIEDNQSTVGLGDWNQCRVDEILTDAAANGEGYMPGCGDAVLIILAPVGGWQIIGITLPLYCGEETAWASGTGFPGSSWAMYFNYTVQ